MADERMMRILLNMGMDEASVKKSLAQFGNLQKGLREMEKDAKDVQKAIQLATSLGEGTDELSAELERINKVINIIKTNANTGLVGGLVFAEAAARRMNQELQQTQKETAQAAYNLRDIGDKLGQVGGMLSGMGQAITTPILDAANAYMQANPYGETTQRWQSAQAEIAKSYQRIGEVAADTLLPAIEAAANLVAKFADFVESNPELVKAALLLGGGLQVAGGGLQMAGQIAMLGGSLGLGGAGKAITGGLATAGKAAGGFLAGAGGAVLGGAGLGLVGYEALAQSSLGKNAGLANLGQYASVAAYGAGSLFGQDTAEEWFRTMGEMTGVIEAQADAAERNTQTQDEEPITEEKLNAYAAWQEAQQARLDHERESEAERTSIVAESGAERARLEADYEAARNREISNLAKQSQKSMQTFQLAEARAEAAYYQQRSAAARRHGVETARMEADHQRQMRRMLQDHNSRLNDAIANRDASAFEKENIDYETNRSRAEEDYSVEAARRNADFAAQMADLERNFAQQRAQRAADYKTQQQERLEQHAERLAQMAAQHAEELTAFDKAAQKKLDAFDEQNKRELEHLRSNETERKKLLNAIAVHGLTQLQYQSQQLFAKWNQQFRQYVMSAGAGGGSLPNTIQARARGGPVKQGAYYLVGEDGPEIYAPGASGMVFPNQAYEMLANRRQMGVERARQALTVNVGGNFYGATSADIGAIRAAIKQEIQQTFAFLEYQQ